MLKIVEIHLSDNPHGEYVVLQNQGLTTLTLRGWALCGDSFLSGDARCAAEETYIFTQDEQIKPYTRVVLFTGPGEPCWHPTNDGKQALLIFWGKPAAIWATANYVHLLRLTASRKIVGPWDSGFLPAAEPTPEAVARQVIAR